MCPFASPVLWDNRRVGRCRKPVDKNRKPINDQKSRHSNGISIYFIFNFDRLPRVGFAVFQGGLMAMNPKDHQIAPAARAEAIRKPLNRGKSPPYAGK